MAGNISMSARREVAAAVAERYRSAGRREKGRILDELTAVTGWHRKHAVRVLRAKSPTQAAETVPRKRRYNAAIRDAVTALWEASDRVPSKLDPHLATIEDWLAAEPQITALAILRRLTAIDPDTFGDKQHSIVQRLLKALRRKAAQTVIAETAAEGARQRGPTGVGALRSGYALPPARQHPRHSPAPSAIAPG
jgi:hypothetical protein